jgi:hypothetical protein
MDQGQHVLPAGRLSQRERENHAHSSTVALTLRAGTVANHFLRQNCYYHYVCLCCC